MTQRIILLLVAVVSIGGVNLILYREHRRRQREFQKLLEILAESRRASSEMARRLTDWSAS